MGGGIHVKRLMGALCLMAMLAGIFCAGCGNDGGNGTGVSSTRYTADSTVTRRADETERRGRVAYDVYAESGSARDSGRRLTYATGTDGSVLPDGNGSYYRHSALTGKTLERTADGNDQNGSGDGRNGGGEVVTRRDLMTRTDPGA